MESLNRATDEINRWETEISIERNKFKALLNSATQQLTSRGKKLEKSIERARPYYETLKDVKQVRHCCLAIVAFLLQENCRFDFKSIRLNWYGARKYENTFF